MENVTTVEITAVISDSGEVTATLATTAQIGAALTVPTIITPPTYGGSYEVTPSASEQTLETDGYIMDGNITIAPIPNNYGLITWDGSTITVS